LGKIFILSEEVSAKIAAGEVIEAPFSVVRELIDNSLDAGATNIRIVVNNGGKDYIHVSDNGTGMSCEDAVLAVQKHTTSKIRDFTDLDTLVTMGFRGEALSSICTVSDFTLLTRSKNEETGVKVSYSFGKYLGAVPSASNIGTNVSVRNLFSNLPARKKFLKSNRAETLLVKDEVLKKSICFHERGFYFSADDKVIFSLIPRGDERERISDVFGRGLEESLQEVGHEDEHFSLRVFISNRNYTLANRRGQFFFVNRRPVFDRSLSFALNDSSKEIVPAGRFVYAFVFMNISGSLLDVNVHPAKKEIRIKIQNRIYSELHRITEKCLMERFYPSFSEGKFADTVFVNEPELTEQGRSDVRSDITGEDIRHETELLFGGGGVLRPSPGRVVSRDATAFTEKTSPRLLYRGALFQTYLIFEGADYVLLLDQHAAHERVLYERFRAAAGYRTIEKQRFVRENGSVGEHRSVHKHEPVRDHDFLPEHSPVSKSEPDLKHRNGPESALVLNHLLIPINFTPPLRRYADVIENIDRFKEAGIVIEPFGEESFNIVALPAGIPESREGEVVSELLEELYQGKLNFAQNELRERFLKIASCRSAVKEGDVLNSEEASRLLEDLEKTEVPYMCPHGRPTVVKLSKRYFEKVFKRG